ncbi:MAG: AEC family transporter [Pseudomonadota bacterium]
MNENALVSVVLPVFCFIGLGYLLVAGRVLKGAIGEALADFVFKVAIPFHLFRAIATLELPDINPWPFWLAYFGGAAVNIALAVIIIQRVFGRDARVGVIAGMCASYSNIVMAGMPMVTQAFGEPGLVTILLLIAVHVPVMMTVSAVMIEIAEVRDGTRGKVDLLSAMGRVIVNLAQNQFIIAIVAGALWRMTGWTIPALPLNVLERLGETSIPLALVALGMSLHQYGIKGNILPAIAIGSVKLLVMPVVVFVLARFVFDLPPLAVAVAVVAAACPTGANAYLIATRFQTGLALSANTITLTTALSLLTVGIWFSFLPPIEGV